MYGVLAKIEEPGKAIGRDIESESALLYLFVAALDGICSCLGDVVELIGVKEAIPARLTVGEQDVDALVVVVLDGVLKCLSG
jgi:hypothetical protein